MRQSKIKRLFTLIPFGSVVTAKWLKTLGYSASDLQQYLKNSWIEHIGYSAYKRNDCGVEKFGMVYGLQQNYDNQFWLGGISALELKGAGHYIRKSPESDIYLYASNNKLALPKWFTEYGDYRWKLIYSKTLGNTLGIEEYDLGNFVVKISSRERALLEFVNNVPKYHGFNEANYLVENSSSFRPELIQELLEQHASVKTKRIILFLAERNRLAWFDEINLGKIDLGSGDRSIIKDGIFDKKYKITYPKDLFADDRIPF